MTHPPENELRQKNASGVASPIHGKVTTIPARLFISTFFPRNHLTRSLGLYTKSVYNNSYCYGMDFELREKQV